MALEKQIAIDKIEVLELGQIQVRQITRVIEDGKELSASYHRWSLAPGDDLAGQDPKVAAIANATWTADVVAAYKAQQEANAAKLAAPATPTA
jgi:hypothetical protein